MARWLKITSCSSGDQGSIPNTHWWLTALCNCSPEWCLLLTSAGTAGTWCTFMHTDKAPIQKQSFQKGSRVKAKHGWLGLPQDHQQILQDYMGHLPFNKFSRQICLALGLRCSLMISKYFSLRSGRHSFSCGAQLYSFVKSFRNSNLYNKMFIFRRGEMVFKPHAVIHGEQKTPTTHPSVCPHHRTLHERKTLEQFANKKFSA